MTGNTGQKGQDSRSAVPGFVTGKHRTDLSNERIRVGSVPIFVPSRPVVPSFSTERSNDFSKHPVQSFVYLSHVLVQLFVKIRQEMIRSCSF